MYFESSIKLLLLLLLLNVVCKISAGALPAEEEQLVVELPNGKIRGQYNGHYYSYESIPYAQSPLGQLRFEAPQPYTKQWTEIRDATQPPLPCMQWDQFVDGDNKLHGVEDCLTLHVYKPRVSTAIHNATMLPVMVLIHGGAFMFGSTRGNNHERLMQRQHFIVVKMNYRLGPLGFLSTEDSVMPGNYGLKDQRLALQWIKQNIACFGGDATRMIVLGFSSGGAAVHLQMLQPNFGEYAQAAASFSGTALNPWVVQRKPRVRALELARNVGCTDISNTTAVKHCLQSKTAEEIVRSVRDFLVFGYNPFATFGPVVEPADVHDAFLTQMPEELIRAGRMAHVPWLASYASQDGGYNAAELLQLRPRRGELIEELNDRWFDLAPYTLFYKDSMQSIEQLDDHSSALKRRYLGNKEFNVESYHDVQRMYTDVLFRNGVEEAVRLHREHSQSSVYAYVYDNPADQGVGNALAKRNDIKFGTIHGDDFFLIFDNVVRSPTLRADEEIISNNFLKMLEDFVQKSDKLSFGSCQFVDNNKNKTSNQHDLHIMKITQYACENLNVQRFP